MAIDKEQPDSNGEVQNQAAEQAPAGLTIDIEALLQKQRAHEQETQATRAAAEAEAQRKAQAEEAMVQYRALMHERRTLLARLQKSGFDPSRSERASRQLVTLEEQKTAMLNTLQQKEQALSALQSSLEQVKSLVSPGFEPTADVAAALNQVSEAVRTADAELLELKNNLNTQDAQIKQKEAEQTTDPAHVADYQALQEVDRQIAQKLEYEEVKNTIHGQAETENQRRDQLLDTLTRSVERSSYESGPVPAFRNETVRGLIEQFLSEELERNNLDGIEEYDLEGLTTGMEAEYDWNRVLSVLRQGSDPRDYNDKYIKDHAQAIIIGMGFRQLLGSGPGTPSAAPEFLSIALDPQFHAIDQVKQNRRDLSNQERFFDSHLGVFNRIKAIVDGSTVDGMRFNVAFRQTMPDEIKQWGNSRSAMETLGYSVVPGSPITPRRLDTREAREKFEAVKAQYSETKANTEEKARELREKYIAEQIATRERFNAELATIDQRIQAARTSKVSSENESGFRERIAAIYRELPPAQRKIQEAEYQIKYLEQDINDASGIFKIGTRRRLEAEKNNKLEYIRDLKERVKLYEDEYKRHIETLSTIKKHRDSGESEYTINSRKREIESAIQTIDQQLVRLQSKSR